MGPDVEALLSINQARAYLGAMKGVKRISYPALVRLVQKEGLPTVPNPFSPGSWAFQKSLIETWFRSYTTSSPRMSAPMRGPGRPRKERA